MTIREAYTEGMKTLLHKGILEADLDAWYLLEHVTGISRALYFSDSGRVMDAGREARYFNLIEKRGMRIPLQHLTGVQEFIGFKFLVNEHVLIQRQDTEILVEEALAVLKANRGTAKLLDMCTGSGCILLSILKLMHEDCGYVIGRSEERHTEQADVFQPPDWSCEDSARKAAADPSDRTAVNFIYGTGTDLSEKALETAGKNAEILGAEAVFYQSDLFEKIDGRFSMIVSNPPYIRTGEIETLQEEVRAHDPRMALDGGADGLDFYRRIIRESPAHLLPKGSLLLEIGCGQAREVAGLMREAGFQRISVKKDLAGLDRVVSGVYDDL